MLLLYQTKKKFCYVKYLRYIPIRLKLDLKFKTLSNKEI